MLNDFRGNFIKNILKGAVEAKEEARKRIEEYYQKLEERFDKSVPRLAWYVAGRRVRLLTTPLGDIKISRQIYR